MRPFTLIEMLVVIAVIGILTSLLMPALRQAQDYSKRLQCLSQTRTVSTLLFNYADDWNGSLPKRMNYEWFGGGFGNNDAWNNPIRTLFHFYVHPKTSRYSGSFLNSYKKLILCPESYSEMWSSGNVKSTDAVVHGKSAYGYNSYLPALDRSVFNVKSPSRCTIAGETFDTSYLHVSYSSCYKYVAKRHSGENGSYVFVDGHAGYVPLSKVPLIDNPYMPGYFDGNPSKTSYMNPTVNTYFYAGEPLAGQAETRKGL